jgi:CrcB protein
MNPFLAVTAVALGGAIGSIFRYLLATWFVQQIGSGFPWATFTINVSGSFLIGIVLQLAATRSGFDPHLRLFLATGILGGFTTFSTFSYETYALSGGALSFSSVFYALGSVIAGVAAVYVGVTLARAFAAA